MTEIGAFEAKNQFSKLLDRARNGEAFTITHRGVAVAQLIPAPDAASEQAALHAFERLRRRASHHRGAPISTGEILGWKAEGRR